MERTHEQARARIPMTAEQVRTIINTMECETKSRAARKSMAIHAIAIANVTDEGRAVWVDYLATFD